MHNLTCAACGRALAETSAWKGSGERFYCNDFCAEAEETDINLSLARFKSREQLVTSGCEAQRFDLRFFRPFRADLSIRKSSSFFPRLIAATSHLGLAPRPAQVSPDGPRYFGGTFLPFNALPPPRTALLPPTTANILNCFSISARRSLRVSSTRFRSSISASTVIRDRFTFGIVISGEKTE